MRAANVESVRTVDTRSADMSRIPSVSSRMSRSALRSTKRGPTSPPKTDDMEWRDKYSAVEEVASSMHITIRIRKRHRARAATPELFTGCESNPNERPRPTAMAKRLFPRMLELSNTVRRGEAEGKNM